MTQPMIRDVRLLPPDVFQACSDCLYPAGRRTTGKMVCAVTWCVSPEGRAISRLCAEHAERCLSEILRVEAGWTLAPIYHDDPTDRTERERGEA